MDKETKQNVKKIPIEMRLPVYPIPQGEDEPRTYQTAGEVRIYTVLEVGDGFKTADEFIVMGNADAKILNAYVKGFKEMMESDKDAMKHYLVGERDVKVSSYNAHNSTEPASPGTSHHSAGSTLPPLQVTGNAGSMKGIKVFDFNDSHICPFCWEDGYTIKLRDGTNKYVPQGGHNKVGEKDLMYSAKYGRPIAMCYHHQQVFYKDESAKSKMVEQLMVIDKEIENNPQSDYHIRTVEVEVKV